MKYQVNFHAEIVIKGMIKSNCIITRKKNPIDEEESQTEQADWCGLEALSLRKCVAVGRDSMNRSTWNIADYSLDTASRHLFANQILHSLCVPAVNVGEFPTSSDSNCSGKDVCEP